MGLDAKRPIRVNLDADIVDLTWMDLFIGDTMEVRGKLQAKVDAQGTLLTGPGVQDPLVAEQVEIQVKYAGYIARQQDEVQKQIAHEQQAIPADVDYDAVTSLSFEVRQKLKTHRPETIGQAARISGVTPAAISLLLIHLKRLHYGSRKQAA